MGHVAELQSVVERRDDRGNLPRVGVKPIVRRMIDLPINDKVEVLTHIKSEIKSAVFEQDVSRARAWILLKDRIERQD